jgi:hypothetical protein
MEIIKLEDTSLYLSSISEALYDEWDIAETYDTSDYVYVSFEDDGTTGRTPHEVYISLSDANVGNYPPDDPGNWSLIGATNRWKMFDGYVNTQSEDTEDIVVHLDSSVTNYVGLFLLNAKSVTFSLYKGQPYIDEDGEVMLDSSGNIIGDFALMKNEIIDLDDSPIYDYYDYFFAEMSYREDAHWSYPYYTNSMLIIEIETYESSVKCGMIALGNAHTVGVTKSEVTVSTNDYSKKDTDDLGRTYLSQGYYSKNNDVDFWIDANKIDMVRRLLERLRGTPVIVNANNPVTDYESLIIYGFLGPFSIIVPGDDVAKCSLEVKGLT